MAGWSSASERRDAGRRDTLRRQLRADMGEMTRFGRYQVEDRLLETGFSDLYTAWDPDLGLRVAIKAFHPKGDNTGEAAQYGEDFWRARFVEEARLMAGFDHPHIARLLALQDADGPAPWFAMPYYPANLIYEIGEDAADAAEAAAKEPRWRPKALVPARAIRLWRQLLSALAYLHRQGFVHRDIKPANVLLHRKQGGDVRLCDFGMLKVPNAEGSRSGIWIGSKAYMSPEQRRSAKEVDARADVYAAAAVFCRMLTGRMAGPAALPPGWPTEGAPVALRDLVAVALAERPSDRPRDAAAVLRDLARIVPDDPPLRRGRATMRRGSTTRTPGNAAAAKRRGDHVPGTTEK